MLIRGRYYSKRQGGWFWIPAAISAVAALAGQAKQSHADRQARLAAQDAADRQRAQDIANQQTFAQNSLSWKVQDARNAGLHPLFAIGGSGTAYQSPGISVYTGGGGGNWAAMGQTVGRAVTQVADAYEKQARGVVEVGPLDERSYQEKHGYDAWWDSAYGGAPGDTPGRYVSPVSVKAPRFGFVSDEVNASSAWYAFPRVGKVILPATAARGQFQSPSEALEALDSLSGQALYIYINAVEGTVEGARWLWQRFRSMGSRLPSFEESVSLGGSLMEKEMGGR